MARVPPDRTPLYRTGYERYSPSFLEYVDTREDGSQEARSPGPRVEGRTVASPGITVGSGLDHIQDILRAGLIHRVVEKRSSRKPRA